MTYLGSLLQTHAAAIRIAKHTYIAKITHAAIHINGTYRPTSNQYGNKHKYGNKLRRTMGQVLQMLCISPAM